MLKLAFVPLCLFAMSIPARAQTNTDYPTIAAILTKVSNGKLANDPQGLLGLAQNPFCLQYGEATNEFERRDYLAKLRQQLLARAEELTGEIQNVGRMYDLSEYDFTTKSFKIRIGQHEWQTSIGWGDLAYLKTCWKAPVGNMFAYPNIVDVMPDWKVIPTQLQVTEGEARQWYATGRPRAAVTVTIKAKGYTVEPMRQPKFIIRGDTIKWTVEIKDSKLNVLKTYTSEAAKPVSSSPAPAPTASLPPPPPAVPLGTRTVTATFNVRKQPSTASPLSLSVQPGQTVKVNGSNPDGTWSMVSVPGIADGGWVLNSVLVKNSRP